MSRKAGLSASAIGLVALVLGLLARDGSERSPPPTPSRLPGSGRELVSLVRRPEPLAPAAFAAESARVELQPTPDPTMDTRLSGSGLRVRVVREEDREPLPEACVSLRPTRDSTPEVLVGTTDSEGACTFELEGTDWSRGELAFARVTTSEPGPFFRAATGEHELFTGSVPIADEIVLVAASLAMLHGHVLVEPAGAGRPSTVRAIEPAHGARTTPVFLGRAEVDPSNAFAIPVSPGHAVPLVELEVGFGDIALARRVSWSELVSEEGAEIRVQLGELALLVADSHGEPVAGAEVRVLTAEHGERASLAGRTAESGELRVALPAGLYRVCVAAPGFVAALETWTVAPGSGGAPRWIQLRALGPHDSLVGRVALADGSAVGGAIVVAAPGDGWGDLTLGAGAQTRSTEDGSFELAIDVDRELTLGAYHREHGVSDEPAACPTGAAPCS
jgi:hypothetical protein